MKPTGRSDATRLADQQRGCAATELGTAKEQRIRILRLRTAGTWPQPLLAVGLALTALLASGTVGSASAATSCSQVPTVYGIPPWGFHTGSYTGESSFAKGHGNIDLEANTVSGVMCQQDRAGVIIMSVEHHLAYHSHYAMRWGYPGNIMKIKFRVTSSTDKNCPVGTVGRATLYASYNGVRSDSVQFFFPAACRDQRRLYHGTQVNNQVPPL